MIDERLRLDETQLVACAVSQGKADVLTPEIFQLARCNQYHSSQNPYLFVILEHRLAFPMLSLTTIHLCVSRLSVSPLTLPKLNCHPLSRNATRAGTNTCAPSISSLCHPSLTLLRFSLLLRALCSFSFAVGIDDAQVALGRPLSLAFAFPFGFWQGKGIRARGEKFGAGIAHAIRLCTSVVALQYYWRKLMFQKKKMLWTY